jgi:hypothetical protein
MSTLISLPLGRDAQNGDDESVGLFWRERIHSGRLLDNNNTKDFKK